MLQHNSNESSGRDGAAAGRDRARVEGVYKSTPCRKRPWTSVLMLLRVISVSRTGGKVRQRAQSVPLALAAAHSDGCDGGEAPSCSPPSLATHTSTTSLDEEAPIDIFTCEAVVTDPL